MASLIQGLKNFKANLGTAASELQHVANMLQPGTSQDEKKFLEAVYTNRPLLATSLLSANPNVIFARTKDWHNAWHIAAQHGSLPMLEALHTHGRGATRKPLPGEPPMYAAKTRETRETPLMLACAGDHLTAMQYLLGVGASCLDGDKYGNTIVHHAALRGQVKMLSLLLASDEGLAGATRLVDVRNEAGLQPLHFAVWGGQAASVQALFDYRPDLVARSSGDSMAQVTCNGGSTPLHVAALKNDPSLVELLLREYVRATLEGRGPRSDPRSVTDNYHFTPMAIAKDLKREAVINLLDPAATLKGLEPGAVAAAELLRSTTMGRRSAAGKRVSNEDAPAADKAFDGFAALAAGSFTDRKPSGSSKGSTPIPVLSPPPPKAGKAAAAALQVLTPPPTPKQPVAATASQPAAATAGAADAHAAADADSAAAAPGAPSTAAAAAAADAHAAGAAAAAPGAPSTAADAAAPAALATTTPATSPASTVPTSTIVQPSAPTPLTAPAASSAPASGPAGIDPALGQPSAEPEPARVDVAPDSTGGAGGADGALAKETPATEALAAAPSEPAVVAVNDAAEPTSPPPPAPVAPAASTPAAAPAAIEAAPAASTPAAAPAAVEAAPAAALPAAAPAAVEAAPPVSTPAAVQAAPAAPAHSQQAAAPASTTQGASEDAPPNYFLCPITNQIMVNPVIAGDGRAYEADAIEMWLSLNSEFFPGAGVRVLSRQLEPANALKEEIEAWKAARSA